MSSLFILPFDHRSGFAKEILGVSYPYSPEHQARAAQLKELVYEAFLSVREAHSAKGTFGILVDHETGKRILADAKDQGVVTCISTEESGTPALELMYDDETGAFLQSLGASYAKVLVKWEDVPVAGDAQVATLVKLQKSVDDVKLPLMVEMLFTVDPAERPRCIVGAMEQLHAAGVRPNIWKLEGVPSAEAWQQIAVAAGDAQLIVLGRGEDDASVMKYVEIAKQSGVVEGFAIGRTIFSEAVKGVVKGDIEEDAAIEMIGKNFEKYVTHWIA